MLWWLETRDTPVIALVVFAFCYLLAVVMLVIGATLSHRRIAGKINTTSPAMLTPLGVIFGLVIAFLAARVWANVDHAHAYVVQEATEIRQVVLLADALPSELRTAIRNDVRQYLQFVDTEDWPAMLRGHGSLRHLPPGLPHALLAVLSYIPQHAGEQLAQQRIVQATEGVLQARRNRILLSEAAISPAQWVVIVVLDALILLTIAMLHVGRHATTAINLFVFSTAVAACLVLLMINDRPFTSGGVAIQPTTLHELSLE